MICPRGKIDKYIRPGEEISKLPAPHGDVSNVSQHVWGTCHSMHLMEKSATCPKMFGKQLTRRQMFMRELSVE